MDIDVDVTWLLLALPLAFVAGWLASRLDLRQWRFENRSAPKNYFKGLNYLLNEQQDEAIDAFIEAVQQDPDTTELHFALGNLFRRRGDYDRAVRVHEHLLQRADLSRTDHERAQHALAMDFIRAGLLDRAEANLKQLHGTSYEEEAQLALLGLYERTRDWQQAIAIAHQLESAERGSFQPRVAHYWCELAQDAIAQRDPQAARKHLEMALQVNPASARARLDLCTLLEKQQALPEAFAQLLALAEQAPAALPLAAAPLAQLALKLERTAEARDVLTQAQSVAPSLDHVEALVALLPAEETHTSGELFLAHLRRESSIVVAADWLQAESDATASPLPTEVSKALNRTTAPQRRYRCAACGFEAARHFWQCPGCQTWDSYSPRRVDEL